MHRTQVTCTKLKDGRGSKYSFETEGGAMSYGEFLEGLRADETFREQFTRTLQEAPYQAFRWETPPATLATLSHPFECVLLDAPHLARSASEAAFEQHFEQAHDEPVIAFENLRGDAMLVVPCPLDPVTDYCHLASFVRKAPAEQTHALWQCIGREVRARLSEEPLWLSTAGGGVAWLHVRLDSQPKYYGHAPYRNGLT